MMEDVTSCINSFPSTRISFKRNFCNIGWEYGVLMDPNNLNVIKCKLCDFVVKAGIYRLKQYVKGMFA
jgi:hypothetical protein